MPPVLATPPDRSDPAYQKLERKINLMFHGAIFGATNSSLWFFARFLQLKWPWLLILTTAWGTILLTHGLWVLSKRNK